jgi:hypothetical protein
MSMGKPLAQVTQRQRVINTLSKWSEGIGDPEKYSNLQKLRKILWGICQTVPNRLWHKMVADITDNFRHTISYLPRVVHN